MSNYGYYSTNGIQGTSTVINLYSITGAQGPPGSTGPTGAQGERGFSYTGPQGETGPSGPQGPQGEIGHTGPSGSQGPTGAQGPAGATGTVDPYFTFITATGTNLYASNIRGGTIEATGYIASVDAYFSGIATAQEFSANLVSGFTGVFRSLQFNNWNINNDNNSQTILNIQNKYNDLPTISFIQNTGALGSDMLTTSIQPWQDELYNLGDPYNRWNGVFTKDLEASTSEITNMRANDLTFSNAYYPQIKFFDAGLGQTQGWYITSNTNEWWLYNTETAPIPFAPIFYMKNQSPRAFAQFAADVIPKRTLAYSLGSSSNKWLEGHFGKLYVDNNTIEFTAETGANTGANAFIKSEYLDFVITGPNGNIPIQGQNITSTYISATGGFFDVTTSLLSTTEVATSLINYTDSIQGLRRDLTGSCYSGAGYAGILTLQGSNIGGVITVETSTGTLANYSIVEINFIYPYQYEPSVILQPANQSTAKLLGDSQVFVDATTTGFQIFSGNARLLENRIYKWYFSVTG